MTYSRAVSVLLFHIGHLKARVDFAGGAHTSVFDVMRALRVVLEVDAEDEARIENARLTERARMARVAAEHAAEEERVKQKQVQPATVEPPLTLAEKYRLVVGVLRDIAVVASRVSSVLARIEKERAS